jgi:hypothetical protein
MSRAKQCATVQTQGDAHSHNPIDTRTTQHTVGHPRGLKALAGAVLGRTTPRTRDAHCAQTACISSAENHCAGDVGQQAIDEDLERLIQAAADFWHYDADDLRLIRATAAVDPDGLRLALSTDPLKPFYCMAIDSLLGGAGDSGQCTINSKRKHHEDN